MDKVLTFYEEYHQITFYVHTAGEETKLRRDQYIKNYGTRAQTSACPKALHLRSISVLTN